MREFVKALTARLGINGLGRALGLNGSSVLAWTRGEALPSADMVAPLAALAGVEADDVLRLLIRDQTERAARRRARPPGGPAAGPVVPAPKARRPGRRRKRGRDTLPLIGHWLGTPAAA
jgi:hypothetical protein